jgi:hypothetical protein
LGVCVEKTVECYSGVEYAEQPRKFLWHGSWRVVRQIIAEGRTADGKFFEVLNEAGEKYRLAYSSAADDWTIQPRG